MGNQEDMDIASQVSQHRSPRTGVTRSLPTWGHRGSSNADPPIGDEAGEVHKTLPALKTFAGLPLQVSHFVSSQSKVVMETLPTLGTLVRPLPGVDVPVDSEGEVTFEALPTVGSVEGPLLCVCFLMHEEI